MKLFRHASWFVRRYPARLHRNERGDEGISKVLILALIVIPLVLVLVEFGSELVVWFQEAWERIRGEGAANARVT